MSDVDLQAQASLDLGNVLKGLRDIAKGLDDVSKATEKLKHMQEDQQSKAVKGLKEWQKISGKIKGGGTLAEIFDAGSNSSPMFGRMAAGLAVAAFGFRVLDSVVKANIDRVNKFNEAQQRMIDLFHKTRDAEDAVARKGEGQNTDAYRNLYGLAGEAGIKDALSLEKTGNISHEQSMEIAGKLIGRFGRGDASTSALQWVSKAAQVGLNPDEVTQSIIGQYAATDEAQRSVTELAYYHKNPRLGVPLSQSLDDALANTESNPFLQATAKDAAIRSQIPGAERSAVQTVGSRAAGEDVSDAARPGVKNISLDYRDLERREKVLRDQAAQQLKYLGAPMMGDYFMMLFGGQGPYIEQLRRIRAQEGNARF